MSSQPSAPECDVDAPSMHHHQRRRRYCLQSRRSWSQACTTTTLEPDAQPDALIRGPERAPSPLPTLILPANPLALSLQGRQPGAAWPPSKMTLAPTPRIVAPDCSVLHDHCRG
eukprot:3471319-Rhodomonas_salina.2